MKGVFLHVILLYLIFSSCSIQKNAPLKYLTDGRLIEIEPGFEDCDFDGVPDRMDKEKKSPLFAAVDIHGRTLDSDGDGCPDSEDPQPFSDLQKPTQNCENIKINSDSIKKHIEICRIGGSNKSSPGDWYLPMIFFDYNSSAIRKDAEPELNYIIEIMQHYTCLKIIISGHRIDVGKTTEPAMICEERSRNAIQYLTDHGIAPDRLSLEHTYKKDFLNYEVDFNQLRRVEFHIIKK